jgi:hypothetical protein
MQPRRFGSLTKTEATPHFETADCYERGVREAVGIWRGAISGNMKISF